MEKFRDSNDRVWREFLPERQTPLFDTDFAEYPEIPESVVLDVETILPLLAAILRDTASPAASGQASPASVPAEVASSGTLARMRRALAKRLRSGP